MGLWLKSSDPVNVNDISRVVQLWAAKPWRNRSLLRSSTFDPRGRMEPYMSGWMRLFQYLTVILTLVLLSYVVMTGWYMSMSSSSDVFAAAAAAADDDAAAAAADAADDICAEGAGSGAVCAEGAGGGDDICAEGAGSGAVDAAAAAA